MTVDRLLGSAASGVANLLLFGSVAALWPWLPPLCLCATIDAGVTTVVDTWRPFIDNTGGGFAESAREPQCPRPGGEDRFNLVAAPLPAGFDPYSYGQRPLFACVLVGAGGDVLEARMLRGTGRAGRDREILQSIRKDWRFRPTIPEGNRSWQRLRLNPGPVGGFVWIPRLD